MHKATLASALHFYIVSLDTNIPATILRVCIVFHLIYFHIWIPIEKYYGKPNRNLGSFGERHNNTSSI